MTFDPATLQFFSGQKVREAVVSESGSVLETRRDTNGTGRAGGVTELRSYTALSTATSGDAAGYTIPIGFLAEVLAQMKQYDQLLDASRWIFTPFHMAMIPSSSANVARSCQFIFTGSNWTRSTQRRIALPSRAAITWWN